MTDVRRAGWYDDPNDPSLLHYWDGVSWSGRTMPRIKPDLDRSSIGMPPAVPDPTQTPEQQDPRADRGQWGHGGPPHAPYAPAVATKGRVTPDGAALSGWWKRALGYIIDNILVTTIAIGLTWSAFNPWLEKYRSYMEDSFDAASAGKTSAAAQPSIPWQTFAVILVLSAIYEISLVAWRGQTLGHMAAGIRVRRVENDRPPTVAESAVRWVVKQAGNLVGALPIIQLAGSIFTIINYLFPLWDKLSQALHDKAAKTYVVRGGPPSAEVGSADEHQAKTW